MGLLIMAIAMLIMPGRDAIAKHLTSSLPAFTIAWGAFSTATLLTVPFAYARHGHEAFWPNNILAQAMRSLLLVAAITMYIFCLRTVPLANAICAFFVAPFVAAALAPFLLREKMSLTVVVAVTIGFVGVVVTSRPDGNFDANLLWALGSGFCFANYMLLTRLVAQGTPTLPSLSFQSALGALALTPFALVAGIEGIGGFVVLLGLAGCFQSTSHLLSITAFRFAPASTLAPLVYLQIVGAVLVGIVAFGHWPNSETWIGIAIIIFAGCLVSMKRGVFDDVVSVLKRE